MTRFDSILLSLGVVVGCVGLALPTSCSSPAPAASPYSLTCEAVAVGDRAGERCEGRDVVCYLLEGELACVAKEAAAQ